jgi:hypothetical protein
VSGPARTLYELLPAVHRLRDADAGDPLRGLLAVLQEQLDVVDADIAALYENWFIETADRWVVPYIGDLVGTRTLATAALEQDTGLSCLPWRFSQRAYVANTIGYRRRKGTAAVLEQVAFDVTGWRARAVEFFQLLATNQYVKHVRPANLAVPDLRDGAALARLDGPFDTAAHTIDVRAIDVPGAPPSRTITGRGRYHVPNVGLFLWRLQPYRVTGAWARGVHPATAGFTFDPLGFDEPLFNPSRTEREMSHLAEAPDVPGVLAPRDLANELDALRQAEVDDQPAPAGAFFGADRVPFAISYATAGAPETLIEVPPDRIAICDLSTWRRPAPARAYVAASGGPAQPRPIAAGIDPRLGRLAFPVGIDPVRVVVDATHGFAGDLGGGPYDRRDSTELWLDPRKVTFQIGVTKDIQAVAESNPSAPLVPSLGDAIAAWSTASTATDSGFGLIVVMDSARYDEDLTDVATVEIPAGWRLAIVAADWPDEREPATGGAPVRSLGRIAADKRLRPHIRGVLDVRGTAPASANNPGELIVSGLLLEGRLTVVEGNLGRLSVYDSTLAPAAGGMTVESTGTGAASNRSLAVSLDRSISGPVSLPAGVRRLHLGDAIVDGAGAPVTLDAAGALAELDAVTVIGGVIVERLEASNTLFTARVTVQRRQEGCVRFSHVPAGSSTPRRFRCQPDLALAGQTDPATIERIRAALVPVFTSTRYRDPGYGQLGSTAAAELRAGAEDGSEMGAFSSLKEPQREANLRIALDEYLRSGLEAGIFFVT